MALDIDSLLELELQHTEDTEQHMILILPELEPAASDATDPGPHNAPPQPPPRERAPWKLLSNALRRHNPTQEASKRPPSTGRPSKTACPMLQGRGSTGTPPPPPLQAHPQKNEGKSTPSTSPT